MPVSRSHPLLLCIITLCFCAACIALGYWQLQRAAAKETLAAQAASSRHPLTLEQLLTLDQPEGHWLRLRGHFAHQESMLLDNRIHRGQRGYDLLTPFQTQAGRWLLVNRGWQPISPQPTLPLIDAEVVIQGVTYVAEDNPFAGEAALPTTAKWPLHLVEINTAKLSQRLGHPLLGITLRLDKNQPFAENAPLLRDWQTSNRLTPARHRAYALQWFLFAAIACGIYYRRRRAQRN